MIVVSDTSPITNLAAINQLDLLRQLYGNLVIPAAVYNETVGIDRVVNCIQPSCKLLMSMDNKIKLDQYLKLMGIAQTGGQAKLMIQGGEVKVNDDIEIRRGRKLALGDRVSMDDKTFIVKLDQLSG